MTAVPLSRDSDDHPAAVARLASDAAVALTARTGIDRHDVLVVLGSGWSAAADRLGAEGEIVVPMAELPGFPRPTAPGHGASFRSVQVGAARVLVAMGRVHIYEGHSPATVAHAVRTAGAAGCRAAILTNAAGLLRPGRVGQVAVITDQINLTGHSPLTGTASFVDLSELYSPRLRLLVDEVEPGLAAGVYVGTHGPEFETPAEIRAYTALGADLVGMSTVLEAIAAHHLGLEVLGLALVTNLAAGVGPSPLDAGHILDVGAAHAGDLGGLLVRIIERLELP